MPPPFRVDPGYMVLADAFTAAARQSGFVVTRDLLQPHELAAYAVARRFYLEDGRNFPLWQIGPGIFAANQSSEYEWTTFREIVIDGVTKLIGSYPRMREFSLQPIRLELRYVNIFNRDLTGTLDPFEFLATATNMQIPDSPVFRQFSPLDALRACRLIYAFSVKAMDDTTFHVEYGNGQRIDEPILRLEHRLVTDNNSLPVPKRRDSLLRYISDWLNNAHDVTSPFFRAIIRDDVLDKFK